MSVKFRKRIQKLIGVDKCDKKKKMLEVYFSSFVVVSCYKDFAKLVAAL